MKYRLLIAGLICSATLAGAATTRYVSLDGGNSQPYDTWAKAATSITEAGLWTATQSGDTIMVSNGVYALPSVIYINSKEVEIVGAFGADKTLFAGAGNTGFQTWTTPTVVFSGITFSNFSTAILIGGGPLWKFKDCVFINNNRAIHNQANSFLHASQCVFKGHTTRAVYNAGTGAELVDCLFENNTGGGIFSSTPGITIYGCRIINNSANGRGAGVRLDSGGLMSNCIITGNAATAIGNSAGGGIYIENGARIENSLLAHNETVHIGGGAALVSASMVNCTVVSNIVTESGVYAGGVTTSDASTVLNSIVYFNEAPQAGTDNHYAQQLSGTWTRCCTTPDPATWGKGSENITDNPMLDADFKPRKGSPVINAGLYQEWMDDAVDLAGNPRILQGAVDIGAYEYVPAATLIMIK